MLDKKDIIDRYFLLFCWPVVHGIILMFDSQLYISSISYNYFATIETKNKEASMRNNALLIVGIITLVLEIIAFVFVIKRIKSGQLEDGEFLKKEASLLKIIKIVNIIISILLVLAFALILYYRW